ncbi:DUF6922 domain-containing protein [Mucilaginibacter sp. FT3.2]|uniref:DUF6922 domain-containing protein n=1 Tax=Mucilaginibacter sp. FT3.2 TaxID=2723090 RepID=UPI00161129BF|nr:hypothetical protein [Mucilaginibacter sp. FT3.2]MBB6231975.1 hypothetical protein [Mucilaginibacter sp. FT3.2]
MNKPILSKQAFWDVDMETIDYEKNALFVKESVINSGSLENFRSITRFYAGKTIINTKKPGLKEVNFCCHIFKLQDLTYPIKKHSPAQLADYYGA